LERDLVLLGVLRQGAMHGYRIAEIIEQELGQAVELKRSTTYYLLERLAREGYLRRNRVTAGKRPARWVYELTEDGTKRFFDLLRQNLEAPGPIHFLGDAGLAFVDALDRSEAAALLERRLAALQEDLEAMRPTKPAEGTRDLLSTHKVSFLEEEIAWIDGVIRRLEMRPRSRPSKPRLAS